LQGGGEGGGERESLIVARVLNVFCVLQNCGFDWLSSACRLMRTTADRDRSNAVDLYNSATGVWSTAQLSVARSGLETTSVGSVALFAGGTSGAFLYRGLSLLLLVRQLLVFLKFLATKPLKSAHACSKQGHRGHFQTPSTFIAIV